MFSSLLVNVNLELYHKVQHSLFCCRCFFNLSLSCVTCNRLYKEACVFVWLEVVFEIVCGIKDFKNLLSPSPYIRYSHLIHCQGTSLIRANIVGTTHDLTWCKFLNEILIDEHFLDRISKRNHDSERKTFWNSDYNNCNSNDKVSKPFLAI
jgi:hypothetical protein